MLSISSILFILFVFLFIKKISIPCQVCHKNYPDFLLRDILNQPVCIWDKKLIKNSNLVFVREVTCTSDKAQELVDLYEEHLSMLQDGRKSIIETFYNEENGKIITTSRLLEIKKGA